MLLVMKNVKNKNILLKIILITLLFLITGCTAEFNVEIKDNRIIQNSSIYIEQYLLNNKTLFEIVCENVNLVDGSCEALHNYDIKGDKNSNPLNASISYNIINYDFDYALSFCYDSHDISYSNNTLKIQTSNYFNCFDKYSIIDNVNINVTTGYKVLENNADKVDGNTYTWNITKTNKKGIKLTLDTTVDEIKEKEEQKKQTNKTIIITLIGITILSVISLVIIFMLKMKKNNEI